ncbi:MAG: group II intron reverse transcriptase/maturase, partial [Moorea sp. SIO3I7]|nr:group II intron reverse transcriptase/maturase [Moorena sp. SIO3I7]
SSKMLAVRKVTQENKGKKTAGIDGQKALTNKQRLDLVVKLKILKKAQPTRRVWIDKPGKKEKRPLGIPTIYDRALQALAKQALEPEWEAKFEENSYGFRPGRSCHDAVQAIFAGVAQKQKWVLDADIAKCFDKINHNALINKLNTYPKMRRLVKQWLKAGVVDDNVFQATEKGTPQGGVISPLLANIALHGMENAINEYATTLPGRRRENLKAMAFVRYADDFVIMHPDIKVIEECKELMEIWLKDMGLELKPSKTRITHTTEGFDFLGFNVKHYQVGKHHSKKEYKTLIKPASKEIERHYEKLAETVDRYKAAPQVALINKLKSIIRGWTNYYSTQCSKDTFSKLDHMLFNKLKKWGYKRHSNKSRNWVIKKYWGTKVTQPSKSWEAPKIDRWVFQCDEASLQKHDSTKIKRHIKVKEDRSPYDGDLTYWSNRMSKHPEMTSQKGRLLKRQEGKCNHCGLNFRTEDIIEVHHIIPRALGGNNSDKNKELLHLHCHDAKHGKKINSQELDENPF